VGLGAKRVRKISDTTYSRLVNVSDKPILSGGQKVVFLLLCLALMWGIEIFDLVLRLTSKGSLDALGIRPRRISGLLGLFTAPLLHGGFAHLISNSIPFFVLGGVALMSGIVTFTKVTLLIAVVGGLCTWFLGAPGSVHIGASGLVFGYLGFVIFRGIFSQRPKWLIVGLVTGFIYMGLLFSLLKVKRGVSWTGHLGGFLAGVVAARVVSKKDRASPYSLPDRYF